MGFGISCAIYLFLVPQLYFFLSFFPLQQKRVESSTFKKYINSKHLIYTIH